MQQKSFFLSLTYLKILCILIPEFLSICLTIKYKIIMTDHKKKSLIRDCIRAGILLSEEDQINLIDCKDTALLKAYLKAHFLCEAAELRLIDIGNKRLFKVYIKSSFLSNAAEIYLIEKNKESLFKALIDVQFLSTAAEKRLIELCAENLFKAYIDDCSLSYEAVQKLRESKNPILIAIYKERYPYAI